MLPKAQRYSRAARVTRRADIERIRREGKTYRTGSLLVRVGPSPFELLRVGIVVPKYGHSSVDRNRLKRQMREQCRMQLLALPVSIDVVVWAERSAYELRGHEIGREIATIASRVLNKLST